MPSLVKNFLVLVSFIGGVLYPIQVWSEDCVTCSVQKEISMPIPGGPITPLKITLSMVNCTAPTASFDRIACDAAQYSETDKDFQGWINKCKKYDPKKRSTILEYYKSISCDSVTFKTSDLGVNQFHKYVTPLASYSLWENSGFTDTIEYFEQLRKYYWIEDKKNGDKNYTHLREFAKVLRKPDANGLSFLDHVVLHWDDEDCARAGLGARTARDRLIKKMCSIGVTFANPEYKKKYPCKSRPKYAGF